MLTTDFVQELERHIEAAQFKTARRNVGRVTEVSDGIAWVEGLSEVGYGETIKLPHNLLGMALNLQEGSVGIVVFGDWTKLKEGDEAQTTGQTLSIAVGETLLGRVITPLGKPLDGKGAVKTKTHYPIEKVAPGVTDRQPVETPLETGIKAIDSMIPIGRGQRELIIGDRGLGKTSIALDTIINQRGKNVVCIYVAIGQKTSKIAQLVNLLEKHKSLSHTVVVAAAASDSAALQFIAPYAGCAIGEYFMDSGRDALVVYDDLTKHAWAYRELSLLLRRPSGREAYPGDIFYLHSRLLERAARLNDKLGGGSLTALPIIETQAGDVSAYIPTNVISITDGQIYLEADLFYSGTRPAIDVGLSVSRVGGKAQTRAIKQAAATLRLDLAQYRELAAFAQFGSDLDETTKNRLERGKRLVELLKQPQLAPLPQAEQVVLLWCGTTGYVDTIPTENIREFEERFLEYLRTKHKKLLETVACKKALSEKLEKELKKVVEEFKKRFKYGNE